MTETIDDKELVRYELGYLITPLVPEEGVNDEVQALRQSIEKTGSIIVNEGSAQTRDLAYQIRGHEKAYFGWIWFMARPEYIADISTVVTRNDKIIRHMLMTVKEESKTRKPTARTLQTKFAPENKRKHGDALDVAEIDKKIDELIG